MIILIVVLALVFVVLFFVIIVMKICGYTHLKTFITIIVNIVTVEGLNRAPSFLLCQMVSLVVGMQLHSSRQRHKNKHRPFSANRFQFNLYFDCVILKNM